MAIPFVFNTNSAAADLSDTLVGALIFGLAVCLKPEPGASALATSWPRNPTRLELRYFTGYQLGHIPEVWDPFFEGSLTDPQNGTEEVITSAVSKAFPVSDAALGGYTYALEILTGLVGARIRWRTMPWPRHINIFHRHPADCDWHLEHCCAGRRGGCVDSNPLFAR